MFQLTSFLVKNTPHLPQNQNLILFKAQPLKCQNVTKSPTPTFFSHFFDFFFQEVRLFSLLTPNHKVSEL